MAIEIKELIIRATITNGDNQKPMNRSMTKEKQLDNTRMIIQECVDQVVQIMKDKNER